MNALPDVESKGEEDNLNGVRAALVVGCMMVAVYLLSSVLQVYENSLLNTFYPYSSQFAFLRGLFPSPWSTDLIDWQSIVLLQVVPFLLFFYLAVRMSINPLGKIWPAIVAAGFVGAGLSILNSVLVFYHPNISHLLLAGSFSVPNSTQSGSPFVVSLLSTPWILLENGAVFATLALTGISFGNFSGETPYWIARHLFDSFAGGSGEEDAPVLEDSEGAASGRVDCVPE